MGQQQSQQQTFINNGSNDKNNNPYNKNGYHVLQVHPNSPSTGKLVPFFDFIVAANQILFEKEDNRFSDTFKNNIGKPVELIVYNIKTDTTREVSIVPSTSWGGQGLAGISIRFCSWEKTLENVWHVLDVYLNSPAHEAQLQTRIDFIVGTPDLILNEQEDFFTLINNNMYRPIQLYVYSSLTEQIRLVTITPNKNWGGSGSLGCDIGFGLLHRIPTKQSLTSPMINIQQSPLPSLSSSSSSQQQQQQPHHSIPSPANIQQPPQQPIPMVNIQQQQSQSQSQQSQQQQFLTPQKNDDSNNNNSNSNSNNNNNNIEDEQQPIKFDLSEQLLNVPEVVASNINSNNQFSKVQL